MVEWDKTWSTIPIGDGWNITPKRLLIFFIVLALIIELIVLIV